MKKVLIQLGLLLWALCDYPVLAQVEGDRTLGTRVTRNGDVFEITGGTTRGRNQFHSFQEFSVPENWEAFFNNNSNIANIISRVTGRNISNILGTIKANGNANLILINPNGIFFGPNAKLDIRGSFLGSTANGVIFADGTVFSANATDRPILTVSVPLGLQLNNAAAPITVQGSNLEVKPNQTLALVGGKLVVNGGTLTAPGGQIELGATRQSTRVNIDEDFRLSFPVGIDFNDISLTNAGELNVVATSNSSDGGVVNIYGRNVELTNGARINASTDTVGFDAGNVTINTTDTVTVDGVILVDNPLIPGTQVARRSGIATNVAFEAQGNGGTILINTGSLNITNGGVLNAGTSGNGNAGNVKISATNTVTVDGVILVEDGPDPDTNPDLIRSGIISIAGVEALGNGGNIFIGTGSLNISNGGQLNANSAGNGDAGNITINATDTVTIDGIAKFSNNPDIRPRSQIVTNVLSNPNNKIKGGEIVINTNLLNIFNGGQINSSSSGASGKVDAGNITIIARDRVNIGGFTEFPDSLFDSDNQPDRLNSQIVSLVTEFIGVDDNPLEGNAGNIVIETGSMNLINGAQLNTSVQKEGIGDAGDIILKTSSLELTNGAAILAGSSGTGNAGNIEINAFDLLSISASEIRSLSGFGNSDKGGDITINSNLLSLSNGGNLQTVTTGDGKAGEIQINSNTIKIDGESRILSYAIAGVTTDIIEIPGTTIETGEGSISTPSIEISIPNFSNAVQGLGDGGNISVNTGNLSVTNGAQLNASSLGAGEGGIINIQAKSVLLENGSLSVAGQEGGAGGNIVLNADSLSLKNKSIITAQGDNSSGGTIELNTSENIELSGKSQITALVNDFTSEMNQGNITIDTQFLILKGESSILANTTGDGGNLNINASAVFICPDCQVFASSTVNINVVSDNFSVTDVQLQEKLSEGDTLTTQSHCQQGRKRNSSGRLSISGRGDLPPSPTDPLTPTTIVSFNDSTPIVGEEKTDTSELPAPATGWYVNEQGVVVLTSNILSYTNNGIIFVPPDCGVKQ